MSPFEHAHKNHPNPIMPSAWPIEMVAPLLHASLSGQQMDIQVRPMMMRAYAHPNGFARIPLGVDMKSSSRLFLNVWKDSFSDSDIHNHRWDFASTVIHGRLVNRRYSVSQAKKSDRVRCRYVPEPMSGKFHLSVVDASQVVATQESELTIERDESYSQAGSDFHTAHSAIRTATLMCRGVPFSDFSTLLLRCGDRRLEAADERFLTPLSAGETREWIEQVLSWVT